MQGWMGGEKGKLRRSERAKDKDKAENSQGHRHIYSTFYNLHHHILNVTRCLWVVENSFV